MVSLAKQEKVKNARRAVHHNRQDETRVVIKSAPGESPPPFAQMPHRRSGVPNSYLFLDQIIHRPDRVGFTVAADPNAEQLITLICYAHSLMSGQAFTNKKRR